LNSELTGISVNALIQEVSCELPPEQAPFGVAYKLISKSGVEIPVGIRSSSLTSEQAAKIVLITDLRNDPPDFNTFRSQQTKVDALLDAIPDSIFIQDYSGNILDYYPPVNGRFLDADTLVSGRNMKEVFPNQLIEIYRNAFKSIGETRKPVQENFSWENPELNHYEVRLVPMNDHKILSIVREVTESIQAKIDLEKERFRLRHYLDTAASMFVVVDRNYRIMLANQKTCEVLGYHPDKIIGLNWFETFIPRLDYEKQKDLFNGIIQLRHDLPEYIENQILTQNGIRIIRWRNALLRDSQNQVTGLICSGVDITERQRTEQELMESEGRTRAILDAIPDLITIHDTDGNILNVRAPKPIQHIFDINEIGIRKLETYFPASVTSQIRTAIKAVDQTGQTSLLEFPLSTPEGKRYFEARYVKMHGNRVMGVARDITQSKSTNQILELRNRALEEASDAIVISDARLPDRPVIYCNKAFSQITGYTPDEVLGKNCRFLQGNDQEQEAILRIQQALQQSQASREILRNYRKDGTLFWNELSLTPITDSQGEVTHFIGVLREVTEKIAEEKRQKGIRAILESITADRPLAEIGNQICELLVSLLGAGAAQILSLNKETNELVSLSEFGLPSALRQQLDRMELEREPSCPCSFAAATREQVIVTNLESDPRWTDRMKPLRTHGFMSCWSFPIQDSNKEVLGTCTLYEHLPGSPDSHSRDFIQEIIQLTGVAIERHRAQVQLKDSNERLEAYTEVLEQNVEERTYELKATLQQLIQTNKNLEAQVNSTRQAENRAKTSHKLFAAIARNFPKGLIMVVDSDLSLLHLEGEELKKLKLEGWKHKDQSICSLPGLDTEQLEILKLHIWETLSGGHSTFELDFRDQSYTINSTPLLIDHQPQWALMVWSNTTDRRNHEQELVRALEAQQELNDLKSRFMAMASHEFRTPLSAILSSATLIGKQNEPGKEERRQRYVAQIQNNVRNLVVILDDFLSLSRLDEGEIACNPVEFDLRELLRSVLEEMETNLKMGQHFVEDCEPGNYRIHQDPKLTRHILLNLLSNAIKYSPENKAIELVIKPVDRNVILSVCDQGIGIPKKEQDQIFNRFFRAKNSENIQGTGLGLNIVKQYAKLMGGEISFSSTEGAGSTFRLTLPVKSKKINHEKSLNY
jgi:PAS domain S-box-containing protein